MQTWIWQLLFMIIIGALIGGFTNFLAIRMLFRPYQTYSIGKWKLPFTPGLIPKRQNEIAEQIGKIIVNHLFTPESIQKKFIDNQFKSEIKLWFMDKVNEWLSRDVTLEQLLKKMNIENPIELTKSFIYNKVEEHYADLKERFWNQPISEVIPATWNEQVSEKIPKVADNITDKTIDYVSSPEGKDRIREMIDDFLKERGKLWNLVQMFVGNDSLADRFQPEIIKFLKSDGTKNMLVGVLENEWEKIQQKSVHDFLNRWDDKKALVMIKSYLDDSIKVDEFFQQKISDLILPFEEKIEEKVIPNFLEFVGNYLVNRSGDIIKRFQVEEIIREQIESFSLPRLEELIISIAKKELAMITYLGAILGGLIGLIQGIIVSLI